MKHSVHTKADVQSEDIGDNTQIWQYVVVLPGAVIGSDCNINCHCFVENDVKIGNTVTIKSGVYLWDGITIEDNVFVGPNVTFINNKIPRSKNYPEENLRTTIEKGASIGANSTIMGGVTIGDFAMVGAGSLVTQNIGSHELWYGNPAKLRGYVCDCGRKLDISYHCDHCNNDYRKILDNK